MLKRYKLSFYAILVLSLIQFFIIIYLYNRKSSEKNNESASKHVSNLFNVEYLMQPTYSDYLNNNLTYDELQVKTFSYRYWCSTEDIIRGLTIDQHKKVMNLLQTIDHLFRRNKITYMISSGTLLGSYRHHDIIPWDDDCDIIAQSKDKAKIIELLNSTTEWKGTQIFYVKTKEYDRDFVKYFYRSSNVAGNYPWRWPFVDIFFYQENKTHIFNDHNKKILVNKKFIFPLKLRPLGRLLLPAPRDPINYLKGLNITGLETLCKSHPWNHKNEGLKNVWNIRNCSELYEIFPFVRNRYCNSTCCTEELRLNNKYIHTFLMKI